MPSPAESPELPGGPTPDGGVREAARACLARGERAEVVTLAEVRGSVPREAGTRMLVFPTVGPGQGAGAGTSAAPPPAGFEAFGMLGTSGTIGGGHLELQALERAQARLLDPHPAAEEVTLSLGPSLGQCCGGWVRIRHERLDEAVLAAWPASQPRFCLQLYGAGHVGRAIVHVLQGVDCRVRWVDARDAAFAGTPQAAHVEVVTTGDPVAEVADAPAGAFHLVMTHSHDLDLQLCEAVLRRGDFGFLGLIGSHTKHQRFVRRLLDRGLSPALVDRLICPIGLTGLSGKAPAVVAVSAVAQLLVLSSR